MHTEYEYHLERAANHNTKKSVVGRSRRVKLCPKLAANPPKMAANPPKMAANPPKMAATWPHAIYAATPPPL